MNYLKNDSFSDDCFAIDYQHKGLYLPNSKVVLPNFTGKKITIPTTKDCVEFGNGTGVTHGICKVKDQYHGKSRLDISKGKEDKNCSFSSGH